MTHAVDPPRPPFSGATIDRAAALRHDDAAMRALLGREDVLQVAMDADGNVAVTPDRAALARTPWQGNPASAILLGLEDGRPLVGVERDLGADGTATPGVSLREAGTVLSAPEGGLAAYLVPLLGWHRRHGFCSVCGHPTELREGGHARHCPNCGASHFPRTDPVVIMSVEAEGRLLMGNRAGWPSDRYSVLAGFVSPGETPEEAVRREVEEESGIVVYDAQYISAQPWPFPASLMLGFHARSDGGDPRPGGDGEMADVRWFTREEILAMQRGESHLALPGAVSIARRLIDRWAATGD